MKRFLAILVLLFVSFVATAQNEKSIIIDQDSFKVIHSDVLTGVNIDVIGVDSSRRPCARIKVKINRMSKEDIDKLDVKIVTNNQLTKCKTAEYDNGLIVEMSALPNTRFYFHHPEFGYSNEVNVTLEPNTEYCIEASLNQKYSIVVDSNVENADVYLDGVFKGITDSSHRCTIKDVLIGSHTLKLVYGDTSREQIIDVNSANISFRHNLDVDVELYDVTFLVTPSNANIVVDGTMSFKVTNGKLSFSLRKGSHTYLVRADEYHQQSGQFVVGNSNLEQQVSLIPTYGWLNVGGDHLEDAVVYINGIKAGDAPIERKKLTSGTYKVRIEKDLYKPHEVDVTIRDDETITHSPALDVNFGWLQIGDQLAGAAVKIDGKNIGRAPLTSDRLKSGTHNVTITKDMYKPFDGVVTIRDNQTTLYNQSLDSNYGWLDVEGKDVAGSFVYVDGLLIGTAPISHYELVKGEYDVRIAKNMYKSYETKIAISEEKVVTLSPDLEVDFATVSLSTASDAELWVNGQYKGDGVWKGDLKTGYYTFEARKDNHYTQQISKEITTQPPYQKYTLAPPVPITGNLKLRGVPSKARVSLDGKKVTLPDNNVFNDLLIGNHKVEVSKTGYKQFSQYVTVSEGQTTAINASLSKYRRQIYWDTEDWESFNLGVFADAAFLCDGDYFGLGLGINWRLFRYYSVFIPTLGVRYMNDFDGSNMFGFSFVLNLNWGRMYTDSFSCYTGLGIEPIKYVVNYDDDYYDESYWDYAVVINWLGFGGRHHDFNIYSNLELDCGCVSLGCRYTYYF